MTDLSLALFADQLRRAWSPRTASTWSAEDPSAGQCSVTAIVTQAVLGGEILKTEAPSGTHFYNRVNGARIDFTAMQFDRPPAYQDLPSSRDEAMTDTSPDQVRALMAAMNLPA